MRRGDVRAALLLLLFEQPYNGYGLMQEIEQRMRGRLAPEPRLGLPRASPARGRGLVASEAEGSGKRFTLTDTGRAHVEERREQLGEPWADAGDPAGSGRGELRSLVWQLGSAAHAGLGGRHGPAGPSGPGGPQGRPAARLYRLLAETTTSAATPRRPRRRTDGRDVGGPRREAGPVP
jgi:hypothetical protein